MAVYLSKIKKVNLQSGGSGNPGASNVTMLMGKRAGAIVAIHDIGKGILAVIIANNCFDNLVYGPVIAGILSVVGHIYPFWMKFKGGKGFATYIGVSVALNWKLGLIILAIALVMALISDYIVVATMTVIICYPIINLLLGNTLDGLILLIPTFVIIYLHRGNLEKILDGTEPKIRKALNGQYKPPNNDNEVM